MRRSNIMSGARPELVPTDIVRLSRQVTGAMTYDAWVLPRALESSSARVRAIRSTNSSPTAPPWSRSTARPKRPTGQRVRV